MNDQNEKKAIEEMAVEELVAFLWHNTTMYDEDQIFDVAEALYNAGYRKQIEGEWISVKDRLPETNRDCLLLLDTKEVVIGYCRRDLHAFVEGGIVLVKDVTHWMPLPEPPKMKGETNEE